MPCPICLPYGNPGFLPALAPQPIADPPLPAAQCPPPEVIWVPCHHCIGAVASCCDDAGNGR